METILSSKGQLVLPAEARRRLRLMPGARLSVELRDDGVFIRSLHQTANYVLERHPVSGVPRMVARRRGRKVTAGEISRLNAELL
jgi:AbrB family looped-hinge helix DNA binding protein